MLFNENYKFRAKTLKFKVKAATMRFLKNKFVGIIGITAIATALTGALVSTNFVKNLNERVTDTFFDQASSDIKDQQTEITIVAIDEKSLSGAEGLGRWQNWQRSYYAKAIENLEAKGVKAIGIDVLFSEKQQGIGGEKLQEIIESSKNAKELEEFVEIYADPKLHPDDLILAETLKKYNNIVIGKYGDIGENSESALYIFFNEKISIPVISQYATLGFIHALPDSDSILRKALLFMQKQSDKGVILEEGFDLKILGKYFQNEDLRPRSISMEQLKNTYNFQTAPEKSIAIPLEGKGQMRIYFQAPKQTFPQISFVDVVNNDFDASMVRDKIVLIGATAKIIQDIRPVSNAKTNPIPGVEIHAHTIQTMLDQHFLIPQSEKSTLMTSATIAFILTMIFMFTSIWQGIAALLVVPILSLLSAKYTFGHGIISNAIALLIILFTTYIFSLLLRYFTEIKNRRFLKSAFSHYVSSDVVDAISLHPENLKLGGEAKYITVFFSDIVNFTQFSEQVSAEQMVSQMNEYFTVMTEIILRNGGTLDKYEGDSVMAFFGAPLTNKNHAIKACLSAIECRKAMKLLNEKWTEESRKSLDFRVGINTGYAIVGNIGSKHHFNYTVMGDMVNIASRLEKANKEYDTRILISEATFQEINTAEARELFIVKKIGEVELRGKKEKVLSYELYEK